MHFPQLNIPPRYIHVPSFLCLVQEFVTPPISFDPKGTTPPLSVRERKAIHNVVRAKVRATKVAFARLFDGDHGESDDDLIEFLDARESISRRVGLSIAPDSDGNIEMWISQPGRWLEKSIYQDGDGNGSAFG